MVGVAREDKRAPGGVELKAVASLSRHLLAYVLALSAATNVGPLRADNLFRRYEATKHVVKSIIPLVQQKWFAAILPENIQILKIPFNS